MANEAVIKEGGYDSYNFIVADGTGIEKGALLKITDPRTAALSDGTADVIAGIAAREKIANDGVTRLAVIRNNCIADMVASGAVTVGDNVIAATTNSENEIKTAVGTVASGSKVIGQALETATDGETIEVWVNVGAGHGQ